jgi:hypothetical protein
MGRGYPVDLHRALFGSLGRILESRRTADPTDRFRTMRGRSMTESDITGKIIALGNILAR